MRIFFPLEFGGKNLVYNVALINKLKSQVSCLLEEVNCLENDKKASKELLRLTESNFWNLNRSQNADVQLEIDFEEFLIAISEHTKEDLNTITTFRFYSLLKHIRNKYKDNG